MLKFFLRLAYSSQKYVAQGFLSLTEVIGLYMKERSYPSCLTIYIPIPCYILPVL